MTKEEAVARIKDHIEVHHIKEDRAIKIVQALNMAIEALEATKWHYPSRGDYPPMDKKVYLWTKGDDFPVVAKRHDFKRHDEEWSWDCYWGSGFILKHNDERIIAWQYIIPPKEEAWTM